MAAAAGSTARNNLLQFIAIYCNLLHSMSWGYRERICPGVAPGISYRIARILLRYSIPIK